MYSWILNRETTELTGFFFLLLLSCCPPTADGTCFVCLLPKDLSQKREKKKKMRSRHRFHPPNNCELKYHLRNTQSYWVFLCRTRVHQPHWIHLSGSPPSPRWAVHLWPDEEKKKKKNNWWSSADSSVLRSEKSYSHSNGHISLHYISHSKRGINLSRPTEI